MTKEEIIQLIFDAIEMANYAREDNHQIPIAPDTELYGVNGNLDSMGLVSLLVDIEDALLDKGFEASLSDG